MAHYIANARACDEDWQKPLEKYLKAISRHFEDVTVKSFMKFVKDELAIVDGLKCDPASLADWRKKQEMFLWAFVY